MNRIEFLLILLFISLLASAQDVIVKANGRTIACKVISIDSSNVYYLRNNDRVKSSIKRSDIIDIQYGNPILYGNQYFEAPKTVTKVDNTKIDRYGYKNSITVGFLEGGGSLVGIDYERMISKSAGLQIGAGIVGFGASINMHLKPTNRSSYISLQYWHQGYKESFTQSAIGPSFVFRAKKVLTLQIGFAFTLDKGPAWPDKMTQTPIMLTYAIGLYTPF